MSLIENITVGVISGIFSSIVVFIWYVLWKKAINPWMENRLYKGVILDGTWSGRGLQHHKTKGEKDMVHDELRLQLDLQQSGYDLSGIFSAQSIHAESASTEKYENIYKIKGCVHENYALFEYHPLSRKRTGLGTFLMEVKNGGKVMKGNITFLEEGDMEIFTLQDVLLNRVNNS